MRKRINTDELEDYLKDVADGHRMYPSNQIWTNIRENLHGTTRWPALTFIALFIITSLIIGTVFIKPDETILKQLASKPLSLNEKHEQPKNTFAETINPEKITSRTIDRIENNIENVIAEVQQEETPAYKPVDKQIIAAQHLQLAALPAFIPSFAEGAHELIVRDPLTPEIV